MKKRLIMATLALAILFSGSLALAGQRGWGHGMGPGNGAGYGMANINLTEEQSAKLQSMREDYLKDVSPLQNRLFGLRSELRLLWNAVEPERDKITAKQKELSELQSQLQEKTTAYRLDCRAMLTPEQQSQMAAAGPGMGRSYGPGGGHHGRGW